MNQQEFLETKFNISDSNPFAVPPVHGIKCEFRMDVKGKWFGTKSETFFCQSNETCLYLIQLFKGSGNANDTKMHTILKYRDIDSLTVLADHVSLRIKVKKHLHRTFTIPEDNIVATLTVTPPDGSKDKPFRRGLRALVCDIVTRAEINRNVISVEYEEDAQHFNERAPRQTKTMLKKTRQQLVKAGDDFLTAIDKQLDSIMDLSKITKDELQKGIKKIQELKDQVELGDERVQQLTNRTRDQIDGGDSKKNATMPDMPDPNQMATKMAVNAAMAGAGMG